MPVIIKDPLEFLRIDTIEYRTLKQKPNIGFCGQSDASMFISSFKMLKLFWMNFRYYSNMSRYYSGPIIPPTYLRKRVYTEYLDHSFDFKVILSIKMSDFGITFETILIRE